MGRNPAQESQFSDLEPISISRLGTYAACGAKGYLRYVKHEHPPVDGHYLLTGTMFHKSVEEYYRGLNDSPASAVHAIFITEMESRGVPRHIAVQALIAAQNEMELLNDFRTGKYCKPDGSFYTSPRMTKLWKDQAKELGLAQAQHELADVEVAGIALPNGGFLEFASRLLDLATRYEANLLIRREKLSKIMPEVGFDFVVDGTRFLGYMDLVAEVLPEYRAEFDGKPWILIDYKTGKAKDLLYHSEVAHGSMQLSLYEHAITQELKLCAPGELYVALHCVDAQVAASTVRESNDFQRVLSMAKYYRDLPKEPGLIKRLCYDGQECHDCELRGACIREFGYATEMAERFVKAVKPQEID